MDRLTIRNADGSVSQPYWPEGGYWKAVVDKLARYEDTGFEPKEVDFCLSGAISPQEAKERYETHKKRYDEWFAWKQAEEQGRLVILPCKVGDTVYRIWKVDGRKPVISTHRIDTVVDIVNQLGRFGKTVFRTREEAEAALAKEG